MTAEKASLAVVPVTQKKIKYIPPDGGWGWMVLLGTAITNIFNQSMLSLFSLLYGDALEAMGHKTQGAAIVLSTMLFVTNFGGPIAGVIMKVTSARFVAVLGSVFCSVGLFFSGFSTNIWHLVLSYGVLLGCGLGFIQNSSFVAINSYFKLRKSRAVGLANVGTGIGQTIMPHVVRYLLDHYGFTGTCLLLSGLSLHGIGGTLLIQPVEWHMKKVEVDVVVDESMHLLEQKHKNIIIRKDSKSSGDVVVITNGRRATEPSVEKESNGVNKFSSHRNLYNGQHNKTDSNSTSTENNNIASPQKKGFFKKMYDLFDISLLSSPRFINIILGTALSVTSIQNFSMIYPFFLQKVAHMDKQQTATCMSAVAMADIVGRLILPIFQDKYRIKARWMLIMTSVWLIIVRQILAFQTDLVTLIALSCLYGCGRSMVIVARNIAISEQVRMDQVPAAVGLGMLTMGILVPPAGYFLGWIRDYTGSYLACITAQNFLQVVVIIAWVPDMLMVYREERRMKKKQVEEITLT